jgi:hypothetical protein
VRGLEALFALRATAQQVDNTISEWMTGTVGSAARYQILMLLLATKEKGVSPRRADPNSRGLSCYIPGSLQRGSTR